ncbi:MAG TPA: hypothetical protein IGS52_23505 [Oscillatoriaceae cyanobacterium M33_DOE_052]|uniref:Uncharacterized protein n=1 Tax=Planktothricoides sp. SpSt-374 TaxID=2282167 RepID=A0A7C3VUK6_9CYAN|nr:hypothetical protein [Oscillatoriaceae cyanobacterium M33_DOE_052]
MEIVSLRVPQSQGKQIQPGLGECDRETAIAGQITRRALIALPHITPEQWQPKTLPTSNPIIFQNQPNHHIFRFINTPSPSRKVKTS